jgi:hypothetical protein
LAAEKQDISNLLNQKTCPASLSSLNRCVTSDASVYFSPNFASRTSNGFESLMQNVITSMDVYIEDFNSTYSLGNTAKLSSNDFWFLYETLSVEAPSAALNAYKDTSAIFVAQLKKDTMTGQLCYGVSLSLAFLLFWIVHVPMVKYFEKESWYHRNALALVPPEVLGDSKPLRAHIEKLYDYLF